MPCADAVLRDRNAVVDPLGAELVDRDEDVLRPDADRLACMACSAEPESAGCDERRRERGEVDAELGRVGSDSDHSFGAAAPTKLAQSIDQLHARRRTVRPVDVGDQPAADVMLRLSRSDALGQTVDDRSEILAGSQVARRREKHLAVAQAVGGAVDERLVRDASPVSPIDERLLDEPED